MSLRIAKLVADKGYKKTPTREQCLALVPEKDYSDGRTKQCHKDSCDIVKIMARFEETGTISHLAKFEGVYADFSDFDFHHQSNMLAKGEEIFNSLPAETRREFGQSPAEFFKYVNDPKNAGELHTKLPGLAAPGTQLPPTSPPTADEEAVAAKAAQTEGDPPPASEPPSAAS